ncbi:hypothetical protein JOB18_014522 [Solea senegalensis]|uniref:Uncharacterized protein n=1 Tax=Solea senegalensis TaxID=28829 RepID=A0AAV6T620_SOLSE|nr:hypothetical protein JOB18_014522 [Solea senegalensis]
MKYVSGLCSFLPLKNQPGGVKEQRLLTVDSFPEFIVRCLLCFFSSVLFHCLTVEPKSTVYDSVLNNLSYMSMYALINYLQYHFSLTFPFRLETMDRQKRPGAMKTVNDPLCNLCSLKIQGTH